MAEKYRVPVILLLDEIIAHMRERIEIPDPEDLEIIDREYPSEPPETFLPYKISESGLNPLPPYGKGYRFHVTGLCYDETGFPTNNPEEIRKMQKRLNEKTVRYADEMSQYEYSMDEGAKVGIFAYGSTSRSAKHAVEALRAEGVPLAYMKTITVWPFPYKKIREMAEKVDVIIVPELNLGQLKHEVQNAAEGMAKTDSVNHVDGEPIAPVEIEELIRKYI
jgi:2-oxoglutarate ferredoxin oxidoreductase subunit alpha